MANYGLRYTASFSSTRERNYRVDIYFKDYNGAVNTVKCAGRPAVQKWDSDEPQTPVKGSSLTVTLINEGWLPLTSFYSVEDDFCKIVLTWEDDNSVLFTGFLVQDDCREPLTDANHEITLVANDNLGLLKGLKLNEALSIGTTVIFTVSGVQVETVAPNQIIFYNTGTPPILPGDILTITGTAFAGVYNVVSATQVGNSNAVTVIETVGTVAAQTGGVSFSRASVLSNRVSLFEIVTGCLRLTGLEIPLRTFINVHEINQDSTVDTLQQTFIDPGTFLISETEYENCYDILSKVLKRFDATLLQSEGTWNVIRWNEKQYYPAGLPGYMYDASFNLLGDVVLDNRFDYALGGPQAGLANRIFRPFKYDKEQFNYKFPQSLIRNSALNVLGALLNTTVNGNTRYQTYAIPASSGWSSWYGDASKIVVVTDIPTDKEIERYIEQNFVSGATPGVQLPALKLTEIEVNTGDIINFGFSFRASANTVTENFHIIIDLVSRNDVVATPPVRWRSLTQVTVSGETYFTWNGFNTPFNPNEPQGNRIIINPAFTSTDITQWQTFDLKSLVESQTTNGRALPAIPADGLLKIYLVGWNTGGNQSKIGYIKDLQFSLQFGINNSTNVIGHTHTTAQVTTLNIKNNSDEEIFIDDSPRNAISGTLFLDGYTGLIRTRASLWKRKVFAEGVPLGRIITLEGLFWRRIPRTIIEGDVNGLAEIAPGANKHISALSIITFTMVPDVIFIFGRVEIDYRYDAWNGTAWEITNLAEIPADLLSSYEFRYLYKIKE